MPMWQIYAPAGAYDMDSKKAFSDAITDLYVDFAGLPRFYVVVVFEERPQGSIWVGGEPADNFVRVVIDHIARQLDTPELRDLTMEAMEATLEPFVRERGFDWEIHIDETPLDLWRTQGLVPPPPESVHERRWADENAPSPWQDAAASLTA
ncbi:tautomerase family protein [Aeromicrobium sp.]|uniref:tautomerase family protein n=1 Tax=Aeromicrobium sp. TaxID=1871063 RepID=UPI002FCB05A6